MIFVRGGGWMVCALVGPLAFLAGCQAPNSREDPPTVHFNGAETTLLQQIDRCSVASAAHGKPITMSASVAAQLEGRRALALRGRVSVDDALNVFVSACNECFMVIEAQDQIILWPR